MSDTGCLYAAADVGAGAGAAVGLFDAGGRVLSETLVPLSRYGGSATSLADALAEATTGLLDERDAGGGALCSMGIACPGLFRSDGSALAVANLPFLTDANLPELVSARLGVPAAIVNDADAGALAEWSLARSELLYWVFGGGWGGAWVSADGRILRPSVDWDGEDGSLHYTNEPGYSVPLAKSLLGELFAAEGASFERFEALCIKDLKKELKKELEPEGGVLTGPSGRIDCVRAELVLSGPGRWRVFRVFAERDRAFESQLDTDDVRKLGDSATAGEVISRLGELGADAAARTDRLFGRALAEAASIVIGQAERDGARAGVPVYVAGGPSRALGLFGPAAREAMRAKGIGSKLRLSRLEEDGRNANLVGAAVLASDLDEDGRRKSG
ncbi:MAG: ROK family protein [Planctomycetota bacterium]|jgi:predicted NBD/HSP70 family sugar kinase